MAVNNELERLEGRRYSIVWLRGLRKSQDNHRDSLCPAEFRTGHLQFKSQKHYHLRQAARLRVFMFIFKNRETGLGSWVCLSEPSEVLSRRKLSPRTNFVQPLFHEHSAFGVFLLFSFLSCNDPVWLHLFVILSTFLPVCNCNMPIASSCVLGDPWFESR
jgi:hypothetical protein